MLEYKTVRCRFPELEKVLNEMAQENWELHSVLVWGDTQYNVVFERWPVVWPVPEIV
jgi:hypothetical protein